jgi:hypothetical protein
MLRAKRKRRFAATGCRSWGSRDETYQLLLRLPLVRAKTSHPRIIRQSPVREYRDGAKGGEIGSSERGDCVCDPKSGKEGEEVKQKVAIVRISAELPSLCEIEGSITDAWFGLAAIDMASSHLLTTFRALGKHVLVAPIDGIQNVRLRSEPQVKCDIEIVRVDPNEKWRASLRDDSLSPTADCRKSIFPLPNP